MRTVALISGGKDSCYNMMKCVAAGHEIVGLANLQPSGRDELDSFMFQTVGHEGVALIAEAMKLPLYRVTTEGISLSRELHYSQREGDEIEDLFQLLSRVKDDLGVEAVSSGAVLSNYQRLRVENVCSRLGLVSLAYLWQRNQAELLQEMIAAGIKAILIKVASMGLVPEKHLGKSIKDLHPELYRLNEQYGINVCGEGGEYETFTLDCPLFHNEIHLESYEQVVVSQDSFAPVAYLKLTKLLLKEKKPLVQADAEEQNIKEEFPQPVKESWDRAAMTSCDLSPELLLSSERHTQCVARGGAMWLSWDGDSKLSSVSEQTSQLFSQIEVQLTNHGFSWSHVTLVYLYLSSMADYPTVNSVYSQYFPSQPPARVCVAVSLPEKVLVKLEAIVWRVTENSAEEGRGSRRSSMHIQSHSEWAPANIGPYSQAYTVGETVLAAGQIGLDPARMVLVEPWKQPALSLTHTQAVLAACHTHLNSALCGMCFFTTEEAAWRAKECWKQWLRENRVGVGCPLLFLRVSEGGLPRGAAVEWHFIAMVTPHSPKYLTCLRLSGNIRGEGCHCDSVNSCLEDELGMLCVVHESWCEDLSLGSWVISFSTSPSFSMPPTPQRESSGIREVIKKGLTRLKSLLVVRQVHFSDLTYLRLCVPKYGQGQLPLCAKDVISMFEELERVELENQDCDRYRKDLPPLSLITVEGYDGQSSCLSLQACLVTTH